MQAGRAHVELAGGGRAAGVAMVSFGNRAAIARSADLWVSPSKPATAQSGQICGSSRAPTGSSAFCRLPVYRVVSAANGGGAGGEGPHS